MLLWRRTTETNWRCSIETRRWLSRCCHDVLLPGGDLPLANFNNDDINLTIDILIAGDFYWSFSLEIFKREEQVLLLLETILG